MSDLKLLEQLGISNDAAKELIINKAVDRLFSKENDDYYGLEERIIKHLNKEITGQLEHLVNENIEKTVMPLLSEKMDKFIIQRTNEYGEKKGDPVTITEFAAEKCKSFMNEKVNDRGEKSDGYGARPRINYLLDKEFSKQFESVAKEILKQSNEVLIKAMTDNVRNSLSTISKQIIKA